MIVGGLALVTPGKIRDEALVMVLAVLGFIAQGPGGILVGIAGVWAIICKYTLKGST